MWSSRKVRFTVVVSVLLGANLGLLLANRIFGYTTKDHGALFVFIFIMDFFAFSGFALLGLLTA
jgi:hypothetical protein